MKLHTEEQVRQAMQESRYAFSTGKGYDEILNSLPPIELPSDEEINEKSYYDKDNDKLIVNAAEIARFRDGAKWMRNKILNQNK